VPPGRRDVPRVESGLVPRKGIGNRRDISAVLALALAEADSQALIDDWGARRCARSLSIPVIGTLGLVLLAKQQGTIPAARPVVERLRRSGTDLSDEVIREALARVGE
jgi:predicted nucleic acid-binding protein